MCWYVLVCALIYIDELVKICKSINDGCAGKSIYILFCIFSILQSNTAIAAKPAHCCIFFSYCFAYRIKLHILHIVHTLLHMIHIILHIILHIMHIDFICILCILCISNCILLAYCYAYYNAYFANFAYRQKCILCIFWPYFWPYFAHYLQ